MTNVNKKISKVVIIGLMSAVVFVASMISITIPVSTGTPTRIHLGNAVCLLSGLLFGGVYGGLSSGIGSMFYDFTNPLYISSCWITFITKFALGYTCGAISHGGKKRSFLKNVLAAIAGQLVYIVLYLIQTAVKFILAARTEGGGVSAEALFIVLGEKGLASATNAAIAVIIAVPLAAAIRVALMKIPMFRELVGE